MSKDADFKGICEDMGLVGRHESFVRALEQARAYAAYPVNVLIVGDTGVGRFTFAKLIHRLRMGKHPFHYADCALSENFLNKRVLGGTFIQRGADFERLGRKDELSEKDTIVLRDIHEVSPRFVWDIKSLLEGGRCAPYQVIATARGTDNVIRDDGEAQEVFSRLFRAVLRLPSLSERKSDVVPLAQAFLQRWNTEFERDLKFDPEALARLRNREWPGNLAELRRAVEEAAMLCQGNTIRAKMLEPVKSDYPAPTPVGDSEFGTVSLDDFLKAKQRAWIDRALAEFDGKNKAAAARLLGWSPQRLGQYLQNQDD